MWDANQFTRLHLRCGTAFFNSVSLCEPDDQSDVRDSNYEIKDVMLTEPERCKGNQCQMCSRQDRTPFPAPRKPEDQERSGEMHRWDTVWRCGDERGMRNHGTGDLVRKAGEGVGR